MADTAFATSAAQTVNVWRALLFKQAQKQTWFNKFVGTSENSMIQTMTDLQKEAGDTIKFDLLMNLTGEGVTGDGEIEGNEEQMVYYQDSVVIDLRANGVKAAGKMSMKRTKHNIKSNAKMSLGNWMGQITDDDFVKALSGLVNYAGQTTAIEPDSDHIWNGGQTKGSTLDDETNEKDITQDHTNIMGPLVISAMKRKAKLISTKIRPILVDGAEHYVMLIHPYQAKALRADTDWVNAQQYANVRGNKNPIFSGAMGIWDNVIIHEYEKITTRLGAGGSTTTEAWDDPTDANNVLADGVYGARALFCGAQAGVIGYGQYPAWYEKNFDYDRVPGVATDIIYGIKKTRFNSKDFGVIAVNTAYVGD